MKKNICLVLLLMLFLVGCSSKENITPESGENSENTIGMANPIKQYSTLDDINEITKCHITIPSTLPINNVLYSTITDDTAQVQFEYLNHKWTVRGSHDTSIDLSGIYTDENVFEEGQDSTVYLNDFYIERMFTEGQQYTIVMDKPDTNDQELFSTVVWDIMKATKNACDPNGLAGNYADSVSQRATMEISKFDNQYEIIVQWGNDATSFKEWVMSGTFEKDKLTYKGESIATYVTDSNGDVNVIDQTESNNVGQFEIKEGRLYWTGAAEEMCKTCIFEKVQ